MVEKRTAIYTAEMIESMKKVEAVREANTEFEPRRMTAEEKETVRDMVRLMRKRRTGKQRS